MNIYNWSEVPDNAIIYQENYNEVYIIKKEECGERYMQKIGSLTEGKSETSFKKYLDFDPGLCYGSPWVLILDVNEWM